MAFHDNVALVKGVWRQVTNGNVTALRVQNRGGYPVFLQATIGEVEPADLRGALELRPGDTLAADLTLAQLWPGVAGANRIYAWCASNSEVSASHA